MRSTSFAAAVSPASRRLRARRSARRRFALRCHAGRGTERSRRRPRARCCRPRAALSARVALCRSGSAAPSARAAWAVSCQHTITAPRRRGRGFGAASSTGRPQPTSSCSIRSSGNPDKACSHARRRRERESHQRIYFPPLTDSVSPVMNPASSLTRKATARAISSGFARRPTGTMAMILFKMSGRTAATICVSV